MCHEESKGIEGNNSTRLKQLYLLLESCDKTRYAVSSYLYSSDERIGPDSEIILSCLLSVLLWLSSDARSVIYSPVSPIARVW